MVDPRTIVGRLVQIVDEATLGGSYPGGYPPGTVRILLKPEEGALGGHADVPWDDPRVVEALEIARSQGWISPCEKCGTRIYGFWKRLCFRCDREQISEFVSRLAERRCIGCGKCIEDALHRSLYCSACSCAIVKSIAG